MSAFQFFVIAYEDEAIFHRHAGIMLDSDEVKVMAFFMVVAWRLEWGSKVLNWDLKWKHLVKLVFDYWQMD